jgi:alkylhydroperoxidase family enzyme
MAFLKQHADTENFMEALLRHHTRYFPIVTLLDEIVQNSAELTWADCEQIGLELGRENRSSFCAGIRTGMVQALADDQPDSTGWDTKPLIDFARAVNKNASGVSLKDIQKVRDAGWNDQTIEDVVALVACLGAYSTLANGLGFVALPESAFAEMGQATVNMKGYTPLFQSFVDHIDSAA